MKVFIDIVMKRIYLFIIVAWSYRKKIGFPVYKKENFAGPQAHRKRGKSARATPTPHHTLNEERSARFTAQHLSALVASLEKNNSLYCQKIKVHIFGYILVAYTLNKNRTPKINLVKLQMDDKILRSNYLILCLKTDLSIYIRCQKSFGINLGEVTLFFYADNIFILLCWW